ncbi:hypothetical protein [Couchioplanes azureus]|uniref:hypothetical protein n=1 Tax=Couchioplanes caeruleus TaxID=56438 RepID=UPI0016701A52|nr:hypothetical protein [Couchioplanes caeruleus]GGQ47915.1 hypothetical protein GCM10010166_15020 [Couchioplanes caeruleus subsp. azureus]
MKTMKFAVGLAAGYVLGSRAGRETYERIVANARKLTGQPPAIEERPATGRLMSSDPPPAAGGGPAPAARPGGQRRKARSAAVTASSDAAAAELI